MIGIGDRPDMTGHVRINHPLGVCDRLITVRFLVRRFVDSGLRPSGFAMTRFRLGLVSSPLFGDDKPKHPEL